MSDILIKAITADGSARAYVISSGEMVNEAVSIHKTSATVSAAFGRLLTAGSMMGAMLKDEGNSLTLHIKGDGPLRGITVVSDSSGNTRGYVLEPIVELPLNPLGKLDVSGAVGKTGFLTVIKDLNLKEPYVGRSEIVSGEIAEDITHYFAKSEQTPTVCALGVLVERDLSVKYAGGFIIQLLPNASEKTIETIEQNISNIKSVTAMLFEGKTAEDILKIVLNGFEVQILSEQKVEYKCTCSRERTLRALLSIGRVELDDLIEKQETTELHCHFCNKTYHFSSHEVKEIIK